MAVGFSPSLPLRYDSVDGFYTLNKTLVAVAKQNLKTVVLTAPGERIMHPDFGVGARNFLFDQTEGTYQGLSAKIIEQTRKYVPFIKIVNIAVVDVNLDETRKYDYKDTQYMGIEIMYYIPNLTLNETLKIIVSSNN